MNSLEYDLLYNEHTHFITFYFWLHLWHMEVPGPGIKSGLQLQQCWFLNPLCHSGKY